jgi:glycosyltransferase involved in cell wall biosynthesis
MAGTSTWTAVAAIPDVALQPTRFGPSLTGRSRAGKAAAAAAGALPSLVSLAALTEYIRRHRIAIIHSTDRPRDAVPCAMLAVLTGAKSVIHVHVKPDEWMSRSVRWAMGRADALVGVSRFVAQALVARGHAAARVHTVLNAIDPAAWDFTESGAAVRRELDIPAGAPVITSVSRLFRWKGHAQLLDAAALVARELPATRVVIVGNEDAIANGGTTYAAELHAQTDRLGLSGQVHFAGFRPDIARVLAATDVFAMPSWEEPFGLVYAEAMAMKRPVVAVNSGGTPEVVEHGKTGLLSEHGDTAALAANILTLLRNPALRERMGEAGRKSVEEKFAPHRMANDAELVYGLLSRPRQEPSDERVPA